MDIDNIDYVFAADAGGSDDAAAMMSEHLHHPITCYFASATLTATDTITKEAITISVVTWSTRPCQPYSGAAKRLDQQG